MNQRRSLSLEKIGGFRDRHSAKAGSTLKRSTRSASEVNVEDQIESPAGSFALENGTELGLDLGGCYTWSNNPKGTERGSEVRFVFLGCCSAIDGEHSSISETAGRCRANGRPTIRSLAFLPLT